jgi:DNA replication protein DnaC
VTGLQTAHLEGNATAKTRAFTGPSVLVIDELGYLPMAQTS